MPSGRSGAVLVDGFRGGFSSTGRAVDIRHNVGFGRLAMVEIDAYLALKTLHNLVSH